MLERDMDREQLAKALGKSIRNVYHLFRRLTAAPAIPTIEGLEAIFGPMPIAIQQEIKAIRSERSGGNTSHARLKARCKKWHKERLEEEITKLGDGARTPTVIGMLRDMNFGERLNIAGYNCYMAAKAGHMLHAPSKPPTRRPGGGAYLTDRGRLQYALRGLEKRTATKFYSCQKCRQIWVNAKGKHRGVLCAPCWAEYDGRRLSWQGRGSVGPAPALPRSKGRSVSPDALQQRVIDLLRWVVEPSGTPSLNKDYLELADTRKRLAESEHPWCKRITGALETDAHQSETTS
jgi:hypothetical protein